MLHHRLSLKSSSPSITTLCDILSLFRMYLILFSLEKSSHASTQLRKYFSTSSLF